MESEIEIKVSLSTREISARFEKKNRSLVSEYLNPFYQTIPGLHDPEREAL